MADEDNACLRDTRDSDEMDEDFIILNSPDQEINHPDEEQKKYLHQQQDHPNQDLQKHNPDQELKKDNSDKEVKYYNPDQEQETHSDQDLNLPNQELKIFVSGRAGCSKSVIVNGILGRAIVRERDGVETKSRQKSLQYYVATIDKFKVNVWISSSLQDGLDNEDHLKDLKKKCSDVDIIIYCIKMTDTRFIPGNPDAQAITKITETLGSKCWEKAIFVLTYANVAAAVRFDPQEFVSNESRESAFQKGIQTWRDVLLDTLFNEAGVPQGSLNIRVVPAGHYKQPHLPDRKYWLSVLWNECVDVISNDDTKKLMVTIAKSRFIDRTETADTDFSSKELHEQPIIMIDTRDHHTSIFTIVYTQFCETLSSFSTWVMENMPRLRNQ